MSGLFGRPVLASKFGRVAARTRSSQQGARHADDWVVRGCRPERAREPPEATLDEDIACTGRPEPTRTLSSSWRRLRVEVVGHVACSADLRLARPLQALFRESQRACRSAAVRPVLRPFLRLPAPLSPPVSPSVSSSAPHFIDVRLLRSHLRALRGAQLLSHSFREPSRLAIAASGSTDVCSAASSSSDHARSRWRQAG